MGANNMIVPFFDLKSAPTEIQNHWIDILSSVIRSGQFVGGEILGQFQNNFSNYLGSKYFIGVGNGLDAITLSLRALELPAYSNVAVPAHTFIATWLAVDQAGLHPIGIDVDEKGLINLDQLEGHELDFSAVIPVHLHGQTVDMPRLTTWAKEKNIKVVEDCAQAHGAEVSGKKVGTWGDLGAFSFYPTKNLGALGDAGGVATDDQKLAEKIQNLSNYGSMKSNKYLYSRIGYNSRLDSIQAGILSFNLENLDNWNENRRLSAKQYIRKLSGSGIQIIGNNDSVWHHFAVLIPDRDLVREKLFKLGIGTEIHYPQTAASSFEGLKNHQKQSFQNAEFIAKNILSLPMSPWLRQEEIDYVCENLLNLRKDFTLLIGT